MASAGWQQEKWIHDVNKWLSYYANVAIDGIVRGYNTVRVYGTIALCCRNGSSGQGGGSQTVNYGISADINGSGGRVKKNNETGSYTTTFTQGTDCYVHFDTTFTNISPSTTRLDMYAHFKSCYNAACDDSTAYWNAYPYWTIYFDAYGGDPSDFSITYNSSTWNSINDTVHVEHWGGVSGKRLESIAVVGSNDSDIGSINSNNWQNYGRICWADFSKNKTVTFNMVDDSSAYLHISNPLSLVGMRRYYLAAWAVNEVDKSAGYFNSTLRYLPPAPGLLSYQEPESGNIYTVNYVGVPANNNPDHDPSQLTRTVRYKIDSGSWTYIENDTVVALATATTSAITIPASSSAVVEAWMNYHGMQSEVSSVTIVNSNSPVNAYCSVNDETALVDKIYGSVNSVTAKVVKVYASHEGVARKVFEDV